MTDSFLLPGSYINNKFLKYIVLHFFQNCGPDYHLHQGSFVAVRLTPCNQAVRPWCIMGDAIQPGNSAYGKQWEHEVSWQHFKKRNISPKSWKLLCKIFTKIFFHWHFPWTPASIFWPTILLDTFYSLLPTSLPKNSSGLLRNAGRALPIPAGSFDWLLFPWSLRVKKATSQISTRHWKSHEDWRFSCYQETESMRG